MADDVVLSTDKVARDHDLLKNIERHQLCSVCTFSEPPNPLLVVELGADIWSLLLHATHGVEHMRGVVWSLLAAVSLLAVVGLRYPIRTLPLLLFKLVWKPIWVLAIV